MSYDWTLLLKHMLIVVPLKTSVEVALQSFIVSQLMCLLSTLENTVNLSQHPLVCLVVDDAWWWKYAWPPHCARAVFKSFNRRQNRIAVFYRPLTCLVSYRGCSMWLTTVDPIQLPSHQTDGHRCFLSRPVIAAPLKMRAMRVGSNDGRQLSVTLAVQLYIKAYWYTLVSWTGYEDYLYLYTGLDHVRTF